MCAIEYLGIVGYLMRTMSVWIQVTCFELFKITEYSMLCHVFSIFFIEFWMHTYMVRCIMLFHAADVVASIFERHSGHGFGGFSIARDACFRLLHAC